MSKIKLHNVRLSFPNLFKARAFEEGKDAKFDASFLIHPKDSVVDIDGTKFKGKAAIQAIEGLMEVTATEKFGKGKIPKGITYCLHDGNEKEYDGYAGHHFMPASESRRPILLNRDKTPLVESDGVLYAGCYVNALLNLWVQDNKFGKRVNANLKGVQFLRDGEPFGAGNSADADDFDDLGDDEENMDDDDLM